jgi:hypothetical protein
MPAVTILRISRSMSQGLRGIQTRPCLVAAWYKALPRLLEMSSGSDILNNRNERVVPNCADARHMCCCCREGGQRWNFFILRAEKHIDQILRR